MDFGKVTGSRIDDVMAKIRNGEAKTRENYRAELVLERYGGRSQEKKHGLASSLRLVAP